MSIQACLISEGRQLAGCVKNNVGGIKKVYIANHKEVASTLIEDGTQYTGSTLEEVVEITMASGKKFWTFDVVKESSNFAQNVTVNIQNGTTSFVPTVSLIFNKLDAHTRNIIQMLALSLCDIMVLDSNNHLWYLGRVNGLDLTAAEMTSGTAQVDRNGSVLTFTGAEPESLRQVYTVEPGNDAVIEVVNGQVEVSGSAISSY